MAADDARGDGVATERGDRAARGAGIGGRRGRSDVRR
jgi:hypothetical protein